MEDNTVLQPQQRPALYGHNKKKRINKKHHIKEEAIIYKNLNPFKQQEKHFKLYMGKQTDFSVLFDPNQAQKTIVMGYQVYTLPAPQNGAFLVKNFSNKKTVAQIGDAALNIFWKKPYRTNLNSRSQLYVKEKDPKEHMKPQQIKESKQPPKQQLNTERAEGWFEDFTLDQYNEQIKEKGYCFNDKIRWANVGHQYDWTLRRYPEYHTPMHDSIRSLTDDANLLYNTLCKQSIEYRPESALINYYSAKDYMTGHLDDAELDQESPIYSFSFGLSCVFLMGGMTKESKPLAVRLDSGDLFIMSKNSRKCYHGVPRVLEGSYVPEKIDNPIQQAKNDNKFNNGQHVQNYFQGHRININIRQVFPENKKVSQKTKQQFSMH